MTQSVAATSPVSTPTLSRSIVKRLTPRELTLLVIGAGNVGSALLDQIAEQERALAARNIRLRVCAIANSRLCTTSVRGIELRSWRDALEGSSERSSIESLLRVADGLRCSEFAIVDCTASAEVVQAYSRFIELGAHVITPNKKANVLPWHDYQNLIDTFASNERHFLYATNVGAGLPILSTLHDLLASGDTIVKIEGVLSGTLSYLFNHFDGTSPFSALVSEARRLGFTEPDPRVDLSGLDVATKLLVLARQLGWKLDLDNIQCDTCVRTDEEFAELRAKADIDQSVLRYVATVRDHHAFAELRSVPRNHAFANTRHTDNIVAFYTKRYCHSPLVIQGPGAGPEVTAAGVLTDILKLTRYLPG